MRLVLLGCPGAGKGTQASFIREKYHIPQISTGDMLRNAIKAGSSVGLEAKKIMDEGRLVPDDIMIKLVKERIQQDDCKRGFLLDGFPRTIPQAEALRNHGVHLDGIIEIKVPDEEVIKRLSGRRIHPASGRTYHLIYNPPKNELKDDETGEDLVQRVDDHEDTIRNRLSVYHQQTEPLVNYYIQESEGGKSDAPVYIHINGIGSVDDVREDIFKELDRNFGRSSRSAAI